VERKLASFKGWSDLACKVTSGHVHGPSQCLAKRWNVTVYQELICAETESPTPNCALALVENSLLDEVEVDKYGAMHPSRPFTARHGTAFRWRSITG
jgi:hypothetical protein